MNAIIREMQFKKHSKRLQVWAWWNTPVIPALRRLRQEDQKFKAMPGTSDSCP
jgi:hypothetical protein